MNPVLAQHLATHHGLIARRDHERIGVSLRELDRLLERRELIVLHRGVYRHVAVPQSHEQRIAGGLLAVGGDAVVSHRTALASTGLPRFSCSLVELTARGTSLPIRNGIVVHRSRSLGNADVVRRSGWWVTAPERSLIDAAAVMEPLLVAQYAQQWAADKVITLDRLDAAMERADRHRGALALRRALKGKDLLAADSVPEADLGRVLARAGVPADLHVVVTTLTGYSFELDWAYPRERVGLEMDGYGIHLRSASAFDDDRFRRNELEAEGWRILNVTSRQLRRAPARFVDQVRRTLLLPASIVAVST